MEIEPAQPYKKLGDHPQNTSGLSARYCTSLELALLQYVLVIKLGKTTVAKTKR
jgi:hypothetical protein